MTISRCPGCSRRTTATSPVCGACWARIPRDLAAAHADHARAAQKALSGIVAWLGQHPRITDRELEIVELIAKGGDTAHIAAALHITPETVKDHVARLGRRWGCNGRPQIVAKAFQLGYLGITRSGVTA